jgi:hypothetical protein
MQLNVSTAGEGHTEVLQRHHDNPIAGHFGAKRTLELVSRNYYWLGMGRELKAYTRASYTCQHVCPMWHRPHRSLELLRQLHVQ